MVHAPRQPSSRKRREEVSELRGRRESAGMYAVLIGLVALVALPLTFRGFGAGWMWLGVVFAGCLVVSAFGLWRAAEWARLTAGILLVAAAVAVIVLGAIAQERKSRQLVEILGQVVVFGPGVWLLLPRTRDEFRRMRESSQRAHRSA